MADRENRPGDGILFKNERKSNDKAPDFTGRLTAHRDMKEGEEFEIAGWAREGRSGGKFLSLKAQDKRERGGGFDNTSAGRRQSAEREDLF